MSVSLTLLLVLKEIFYDKIQVLTLSLLNCICLRLANWAMCENHYCFTYITIPWCSATRPLDMHVLCDVLSAGGLARLSWQAVLRDKQRDKSRQWDSEETTALPIKFPHIPFPCFPPLFPSLRGVQWRHGGNWKQACNCIDVGCSPRWWAVGEGEVVRPWGMTGVVMGSWPCCVVSTLLWKAIHPHLLLGRRDWMIELSSG